MLQCFLDRTHANMPILLPLTKAELVSWSKDQTEEKRQWLKAMGFQAKAGQWVALPHPSGKVDQILLGMNEGEDLLALGLFPSLLPMDDYRLDPHLLDAQMEQYVLAWGMGAYRFDRYKSKKKEMPRLAWPSQIRSSPMRALLEAMYLVRDMINVPAEDMAPKDIAQIARNMAKAHGAKIKTIAGSQLLKENFPAIHAVGRAAAKEPYLIDLQWGASGPAITLVGKGVCFDSGGLDIKNSTNMQMMKKDMGGAALMLGLAQAIMTVKMKIRLRVLIPAVENAISGNAYRPLDVIKTRNGLTVEIGNTDAEGRVILCDALARAVEEKPDLVIDAATLTGAARIALGTELPALFSNDEDAAARLLRHGDKQQDPLWRLPLYKPYRTMIESKVADLSNSPDSSYGGAITAALYLQEFVPASISWMHIDTMAWNVGTKAGRPAGGEAFGLRALFSFLQDLAREKKITAGKPAPRKQPGTRRRAARRR